MYFHGCAAGVGEDVGDALAFEGFDEDVGAFTGLVGGVTGDESFRRRWWWRGDCGGSGGGRFGDDVGDVETVAFGGGRWNGEGETGESSGGLRVECGGGWWFDSVGVRVG